MQSMKMIALKMLEINCLNAIVVIKGSTPIAKRVILIMTEIVYYFSFQDLDELKPCEIETFLQSELLVNITEHELVPKHEVLSERAKHELLKKQ